MAADKAREIDNDAKRRSKELLAAGTANDQGKYSAGLRSALDRFEGNPEVVLESCVPLLHSQDPFIRCRTAQMFMVAGFHPAESSRILLEILNRPERIPWTDSEAGEAGEDGEDGNASAIDLRRTAAETLTRFHVKEAADGIWKLYQSEKSTDLLLLLSDLDDSRCVPEIPLDLNILNFTEPLGKFKVAAARKPLEEISRVREQSGRPRTAAIERALYRITGDEQHLDYLIEHRCLEQILGLKSPKVDDYLAKCLVSDDDANAANLVFIYRHLQNPGSPDELQAIRNLLANSKSAGPVPMDTVLRVAAHLKNPEIDRLGEEYDRKFQEDLWSRYYNRRNWPLLDERLPNP
ncbi:MAG: hypothetical protein JWO82_2878 [Akkermansiaceae bacterium]|nr:hypothetical protein [Akkermansiaceae bacterium]